MTWERERGQWSQGNQGKLHGPRVLEFSTMTAMPGLCHVETRQDKVQAYTISHKQTADRHARVGTELNDCTDVDVDLSLAVGS